MAAVRVSAGRSSSSHTGKGPAPLALVVYGGLILLTLGVAFVRGRSPIVTDEVWIDDIPDWLRHVSSLGLGVLLAGLTVKASRFFVKRWGWAKILHSDLRPVVRDSGDATILVLGLASGLAEELFFRGLLAPALGLVISSLAFGALHQLRGRSGFIWAVWAFVMGLFFGAIYLATGSLLGSIVAHVSINTINLRYLRDTDIEPAKPRKLGGLLGR